MSEPCRDAHLTGTRGSLASGKSEQHTEHRFFFWACGHELETVTGMKAYLNTIKSKYSVTVKKFN